MDSDKLIQARQLHIAAPVLLPMLEESQQRAYEKLLQRFRDEGKADLGCVAECNAYTSILEDIKYKLQELETLSKGD